MAIVKPTSKFKKDFKKFRNDHKKVQALLDIVDLPEQEKQIPKEFKPHLLVGQYHGCIKCHIGPDYFLIWRDENTGKIFLVRLGSHSELFG